MALKKTEDTRPWNRKHKIEHSGEIALVQDMDLSLRQTTEWMKR
jgi:hypothetical protein